MNDLLRPLLDAIEVVRTRISTHRTYLESNETRTRVSLVDPVLHALGWDPSNPESVALEWKIERKAADYALLGGDRKPTAIVEAKTLGTSLGGMDQLGQIGMYAIGGSARLVTLTDGDQWHLYDLKRVQSDRGKLFEVRLSTDPLETVAVQLLELWEPYVRSKHPPQPEEPEVEREHAADRHTPGPSRPPDTDWVPLNKIPVGPEPPASIRLADGTTVSLSGWPDLQVQVVLWLHKKSDLEQVAIPYQHTRKAKPFLRRQADDSGAGGWKYVPETDLKVSTTATSQTFLDRVKGLLRACGHDETSVHARLHG